MKRVYMDYAATTPVRQEVAERVSRCLMDLWGNPSSVHSFGREARRVVEEAREEVACLIGARPDEVFFTSGGTEADNLAVLGVARRFEAKGRHIVTSAVEHHAVLHACEYLERAGFEVTRLRVDGSGLVDPDELRKAIRKDTILVSVMLANNEVGALQPIWELTAIAREAGVLFHTDAVQAAGNIPVDVKELGVDLMSMSAHKFYGPKGVGVLYVRKGVRLEPVLFGGGQERQLRPGTENVPGIAGMGAAAGLARREMSDRAARVASLREALVSGLRERMDGVRVNGHPDPRWRLPGIASVTLSGVEGESVLMNLDLKGVAASGGSACAAGSLEPSHVLLAMGLTPDEARGTIRFSLGSGNTMEDVDRVLEVLPPIVARLRRMRQGAGYDA